MNLDTKQIRTKFEQEGFVVLPPTPGVWIKDVSDIFDGNVKADKHYLRVRTENGWNEHKDIQIVSETELFGETEVPWHAPAGNNHQGLQSPVVGNPFKEPP